MIAQPGESQMRQMIDCLESRLCRQNVVESSYFFSRIVGIIMDGTSTYSLTKAGAGLPESVTCTVELSGHLPGGGTIMAKLEFSDESSSILTILCYVQLPLPGTCTCRSLLETHSLPPRRSVRPLTFMPIHIGFSLCVHADTVKTC